ncbi:MAG: MBL fold metallo-hydrolase [Zetaproteobacteria bacterium]|nr:MAG: MBL fold metallo-hydrolase [Zetaproteobacteria bacterium]
MRNLTLFDDGIHKFILLNESEPGEENGIESNQYLIVHQGIGMLLDPGGWGVMPRVLTEMLQHIQPEDVAMILLSHQDPDIVGGVATWLELTNATVHVASTWMRFLPHYGQIDMGRFHPVPDGGGALALTDDCRIEVVPAHFLHSPGQLNLFDPHAGILFSGDVGTAALKNGGDQLFVEDFAAHLPAIEGFHRRYMACNRALRLWVARVRALAPQVIAPQHGPAYRGAAVGAFLDWLEQLECGADIMRPDGSFPA